MLLDILPEAEKEARKLEDEKKRNERLAALQELRKALKKKNYQFDIYFGLVCRAFDKTTIDTVFLLLTEALKAAGIARYAVKGQTLPKGLRNSLVTEPVDPPKQDSRGKAFVWSSYIYASRQAVKIREFIITPYNKDRRYDYIHILVDTVWTVAFLEYQLRHFGNPDVIRDVRKKLLKRPKLTEGIKYTFGQQKTLLEFWLVVLNILDFVKEFILGEFRKELVTYHDDALAVYNWLSVGPMVDTSYWPKLERILTHDLRNVQSAVAGTASEFQFYCGAADSSDLIFFSMDIRDLGVELMLWYEDSNENINYKTYKDIDLMEETVRSTDPIIDRKRFTYDRVAAIFREYHKGISAHYRPTMEKIESEARKAFGKELKDTIWGRTPLTGG